MRFRPAWTYIDGIREFGRFFCERTFDQPGIPERATTILQETLENAVKYSLPSIDAEVELTLSLEGDNLVVMVTSTPAPEHLQALRHELELLNALSPEEAYVAAFERVANDENGRSRIGLARVRLEGNVDLVLEELDNGRMTITAKGALGAAQATESCSG
jgi:hypothetical protein